MNEITTQAVTTPAAIQSDAVLAAICFDANGLVPAIAQQHDTGEVLMMAWMNRAQSIRRRWPPAGSATSAAAATGCGARARPPARPSILKELRVDCDGDTLLLLVDQEGVACHTGRRNCFFRAARDGALVEIAAPVVSPETLYGHAHG